MQNTTSADLTCGSGSLSMSKGQQLQAPMNLELGISGGIGNSVGVNSTTTIECNLISYISQPLGPNFYVVATPFTTVHACMHGG